MSRLFEARPEAVCLHKYLRRYQKKSTTLSLPLLNHKYFHLQAVGTFNPISHFMLTWDAAGNQNSPSGRKGKTFLQMMSPLSLCYSCWTLWWRKNIPKNPFICWICRIWQYFDVLTFDSSLGDASRIPPHILHLRLFWIISLSSQHCQSPGLVSAAA